MQPGERKAVVYIAMESNNMSRRESAQSKLGAVVVADSAPTLAPSLASCVGWRARSGQSAWMGMGYPRSIFQFSNISPTPASPKQYYCTYPNSPRRPSVAGRAVERRRCGRRFHRRRRRCRSGRCQVHCKHCNFQTPTPTDAGDSF